MLTALALASRILLAAAFALAGVAKLADREGTRRGMVAFGIPEGASGAVAVLVPLAELVVAVLLLPAQTAVYGAVGALVLLGGFSLAIAWNLAHGRTPDCHCFGQLHSTPASWKTLVRNGVLVLIALTALVGALAEPDASATAWIADLDGAELLALVVAVAAGALLAVGAFAFLTLMRSYGQVLLRLDRVEHALAEAGIDVEEPEGPEVGLAPGTPAPVFAELGELLAPGLPVLLLFTSPNCVPCKVLLPRAAEWQREHGDVLTVAFASDGDAEDVRAEAEEVELAHVLVDEGRRMYESFQANATPSAVIVAPDGTIGSWVAPGSDWIERLVSELTSETTAEEGLPVGAEAPEVELSGLDGNRVSLTDLRGRDTLLLFWNPDCGFCRSMHDDLLAWEQPANGEGPQLVVVSSGDAESTRSEGFRSRVLLDEDFSAGTAFQANGTPMAVLLDADGRIASSVVAGGDGVLELAGREAGRR